jgi:hypothetical protein
MARLLWTIKQHMGPRTRLGCSMTFETTRTPGMPRFALKRSARVATSSLDLSARAWSLVLVLTFLCRNSAYTCPGHKPRGGA